MGGDVNEKVVVVNADLSGTCRNNGFVNKYPNRSFNTGIAEQNMVSFGAGLACEGFIPYVFSMAPFLTMRACEQCRTDVAYGNRNVRMIGVYAGVSGGISGATHWAIEDCGISEIPRDFLAIRKMHHPVFVEEFAFLQIPVAFPILPANFLAFIGKLSNFVECHLNVLHLIIIIMII